MYSRERLDTIRMMKCKMVSDQWKMEERILYRVYGVKPHFFPEMMDEEVG